MIREALPCRVKVPKINIKSLITIMETQSHAAPCSESTEITLKLMNKEEGIYTLVLSGYDFAGNRGIQTYSDVLLDNKAPNVSVGVIKHPREIDDTRTAEYKFYITDLSESGVVNYCFVKKEKAYRILRILPNQQYNQRDWKMGHVRQAMQLQQRQF